MYCTSPLCIIHAMEQMSRSEGRTQDFKIALRPGRKKCGKRSSLTALWYGATCELLGAHTNTQTHTYTHTLLLDSHRTAAGETSRASSDFKPRNPIDQMEYISIQGGPI